MSYTTILESFKTKIKEYAGYFSLIPHFYGTIQVPESSGFGDNETITYRTVKVDYSFPMLNSVVHTSTDQTTGTTSTSYSTVSYVTDHICTALDNINSAIHRNVLYLFDDPTMPDEYGKRMHYTQFYSYAKSSTGFYEFNSSATTASDMFKKRWELYYARNNIMDSLSNIEKGDYLSPYLIHINNVILIMDFFQTLFYKLHITGTNSGLIGSGSSSTADYEFWYGRGFAKLFKYYIVREMRNFDSGFPENDTFNESTSLAEAMSEAGISSKSASIVTGANVYPVGEDATNYKIHSTFQRISKLTLNELESRLLKANTHGGSIVSDFNVFSWIIDEVKSLFDKFSKYYDLTNNFVLDDDVQFTETGKMARTSWKAIGSSTYGRYCEDLGEGYKVYTEAVKICESKNFTASERKMYLGRIAQYVMLKKFGYFDKAQVWYRRVILIRQKYNI